MTTTTPTLSFGKWLREARESAGYKQGRAADALGVSHAMISFWETGKRKPSVEQVRKMARIYDAEWLLALVRDQIEAEVTELRQKINDRERILSELPVATDRYRLAA